MRDIEADAGARRRHRAEQQVACTAGEIEDAIALSQLREPNQHPLPAAVLPIREEPGDEVVAVGDRGKESTDVAALALGRGDGRAQGHSKGHCARRSRTGILTMCRTLLTVVPRSRSLKKRWPCVDMAMRSTLRSSASRISSVAGSPIASSVVTLSEAAASSDATRSRYARSAFISSDSRS